MRDQFGFLSKQRFADVALLTRFECSQWRRNRAARLKREVPPELNAPTSSHHVAIAFHLHLFPASLSFVLSNKY